MDSKTHQTPLYRQLATHYLDAMKARVLHPGDRMPSVRTLMRQHAVSLSTALQACRFLESEGWLEARPRSGYFVKPPKLSSMMAVTEPDMTRPHDAAQFVGIHEKVSEIIAMGQRKVRINLGRAAGAPELYPGKQLNALASRALRHQPTMFSKQNSPTGNAAFKSVLSRRALSSGMTLNPDDILITHGCIEALNLALRAVAQAGDIIAVESPTFYGLLQVMESLGMRALEIPASAQTGISLEALELAIQTYDNIKAVVVVPHLQNPLGSIMPEAHKKRLVQLCESADVALIEDDSYGALVHDGPPLTSLKAHDTSGNVIHCASLHKILAPGLRLGWMVAGRWQARINMLKYAQTRYNDEWSQTIAGEFMASPAYDRHLRRIRGALRTQRDLAAQAITTHFPAGTRCSLPNGGVSMWVELPAGLSSKKVFEAALARDILISPGLLFSNSHRFDHFIRLNCGMPFSDEVEKAYIQLGNIISELQDHDLAMAPDEPMDIAD